MWKPPKYEEELRVAAFRKGLLGSQRRSHSHDKPIRDALVKELKNHELVNLGAEAFNHSLLAAIIDLHPMNKSNRMTVVDLDSEAFEKIGRWLLDQYYKPSGKFIDL